MASDEADRLLWTCSGCGCDYTTAEMEKTIHSRTDGVLILICTVCGRVGDFVDGPDA